MDEARVTLIRSVSGRSVGEAAILTVTGVVDATTWRATADGILETIAVLRPPGLVVVDLAPVEFFAVAGIRLLREITTVCRRAGLQVRLSIPPESIAARVVQIAHLDETVPTFDNVHAALHLH